VFLVLFVPGKTPGTGIIPYLDDSDFYLQGNFSSDTGILTSLLDLP